MHWEEFGRANPHLAKAGEARFDRTGVCLVGSIRRDGTPRISPVEPIISEGKLLLGMMWRSRKALDLMRDPRILVHNTITGRDGAEGEFKVRGRAIELTDEDERERYCVALEKKIGWRPPDERFHVFAVDIENVVLQWFDGGERHTQIWPEVAVAST